VIEGREYVGVVQVVIDPALADTGWKYCNVHLDGGLHWEESGQGVGGLRRKRLMAMMGSIDHHGCHLYALSFAHSFQQCSHGAPHCGGDCGGQMGDKMFAALIPSNFWGCEEGQLGVGVGNGLSVANVAIMMNSKMVSSMENNHRWILKCNLL